MFKKMMFAAALAASFALTGCGAGVAHAGTLANSFVADNGTVFSLDQARSVQKGSGSITVTDTNATAYTYPDSTGAVWSKMTTSSGWAPRFVSADGVTFYNADLPLYVICYGSAHQTTFAYNSPNAVTLNDNCSVYTAIRNASN